MVTELDAAGFDLLNPGRQVRLGADDIHPGVGDGRSDDVVQDPVDLGG